MATKLSFQFNIEFTDTTIRLAVQHYFTPLSPSRKTFDVQTSNVLVKEFLRLQLVYKIIHNIDCPQQLIGYFSRRSETHNRSLRDTTLLCVIPTKSKMGESSFQCSAAKEWNALPKYLRDLKTLSSFKNNIFKFFLETEAHEHRCSI